MNLSQFINKIGNLTKLSSTKTTPTLEEFIERGFEPKKN